MKDYHFDIGDTNKGPLGMCAVVQAKNKNEALQIIRAALPDTIEVPTDDSRVVYVNVYLNGKNIKTTDVDYSESS